MKMYEDANKTERNRLDRQYKEFCAWTGCIITNSPQVHLHHYRTLRSDMFSGGMGHRPPDIMCIPLHPVLHNQGNQSIHMIGNVNFEDMHGVDLLGELERLHDRFLNYIGVK